MAVAPLSTLLTRYRRDMETIAARAYADVATRTVKRTPVDTGNARRAWTPARGGVDFSNRGGSIAAVANGARLGDTLTLGNGVPYIRVLEYEGHSAQAPGGMMRVSIAEWQAIVREAARGI